MESEKKTSSIFWFPLVEEPKERKGTKVEREEGEEGIKIDGIGRCHFFREGRE